MAKNRNGGGKDFSEAAKASGALDGVIFEDGVPYVRERLDAITLATTAGEMARSIETRERLKAELKDLSGGYRDQIKALDVRIIELAAEVESGCRKVPAQQDLPQVAASAKDA